MNATKRIYPTKTTPGMKTFEGKVAIVTGGAGGLGLAIASLLAERGASVCIADLSLARGEQAAAQLAEAGGRSIAVKVDVGSESDIESMVAQTASAFGGVDILVNNAATLGAKTAGRDLDIPSMDAEVWDAILTVNLRGAMLCCKHVLPGMIERGGGAIVNISSAAAYRGFLKANAYAASKAAILALTRSVASQHGRQGIRCNAVAPGLILHERIAELYPPERQMIEDEQLLLPWRGEPRDVANAVAFLASEESRFITGQALVVDGGLISHSPTNSGMLQYGKSIK